MRAADYVDQLVEHLQMRSLWVGEDFALGYKREGTVDFLRDQGQQKGFELRAVDLMDAGEERVSSSRIRALVHAGQVEEAGRLLTRPHFVRGKVVTGEMRGRTIGFPTANMDVPSELALPSRGVYAGWAMVDDERLPAVTNIGVRPTFNAPVGSTVEAHILDWSGDLYEREMRLSFAHRLRDEMKFSGIDELVAQIERDVEKARHLLEIG
jgi:riboflavin kinase/FMN adenylyltransferase